MSETVLMFDMKTKERVNVPVEKVQESFSSGKYGFEGDRRVPITLPDGKDGWVSAYELDAVIKGGGSYDFQRTKKIDELEYGGRNVEAALLGAARGATLGLSDVLLSSTIYTPSELNKIRETNPNLSLAGEVGGGIGSIVMTGGAGAAFKSGQLAKGAGLAALSPSRKVAETAAKVGTAITKGKGGVARTALSLGVAGGIEGAAYGVQSVITEASLGNAELNAELLLSGLGTGIGTGAGFGAVLGGAASGVAGIYRGGKQVLGAASDWSVSKYHNIDIEAAQKLRNAPQEALDLIQDFGKFAKGPADTAADMIDSYNRVDMPLRRFHAGGGKSGFVKQTIANDPTVPTPDVSKGVIKEGEDFIRAHEQAFSIMDSIRERAKKFGGEDKALLLSLTSRDQKQKLGADLQKVLYGAKSIKPEDQLHNLFMKMENIRVQLARRTFKEDVSQFQVEYDSLRALLTDKKFFGEAMSQKHETYLSAYNKFIGDIKEFKGTSVKKDVVRERDQVSGIDYVMTQREADRKNIFNLHSKVTNKESREKLDRLHSTYTDFARATLDAYGDASGFNAVRDGMNSVLEHGAKYKSLLHGDIGPDGKIIKGGSTGFFGKLSERDALSTIKNGHDFYAARMATYAVAGFVGGPGMSAAMVAFDGIQAPIKRAQLRASMQRVVEGVKEKLGIQSKAVKKSLSKDSATPKPSNRKKIFNNMLGVFSGIAVSEDIKKKKKAGDRRGAAELAHRLSDPQTVAAIVDKKLKGVEDYAPETKNAAAVKMTAALQQISLAAKLTTKVRQDPLTGQAEVVASESDLDRFEGIVDIVTDPIGSTTKKISDGTITREEVSALKSVYPMLYAELVGSISDHIADPKTKVSYNKKIVLSTVLGVPLSPYMEPQYVMIMQGLQEGAQPPGPAPRRDIRGLSGLANNELTPSLKALT